VDKSFIEIETKAITNDESALEQKLQELQRTVLVELKIMPIDEDLLHE